MNSVLKGLPGVLADLRGWDVQGCPFISKAENKKAFWVCAAFVLSTQLSQGSDSPACPAAGGFAGQRAVPCGHSLRVV